MITNEQNCSLRIPSFVLIWPLLFIFLFIPPFSLIVPVYWIDLFFDTSLGDTMIQKLFLEDIPFLPYTMLIAGVLLNLLNAVRLSTKQRFRDMRSAFLRIRLVSFFTYPSLFWGILCSIFFLLGPARNVHIFYWITLSLPALNLSGAFYGIPLILQLRKQQKIGLPAAVVSIIFTMIIGFDLIAALFVLNKSKEYYHCPIER